jgi:hypothetical protein
MMPNMSKHVCPDLLPLVREHIRGCVKCREGVGNIFTAFPLAGMALAALGMSRAELLEFLTKEDTPNGGN